MLKRLRIAAVLVAACSAAFGDTLVVPNAQANAPGNAAVPLGPNAVRIQEVVGNGQFTGVPIVITGIHVRSANGTGPLSFNETSFKITLSTTQVAPNIKNGKSLPSLTFANNVGPDATTVYNAALAGSSPGCSGTAPCSFDVAVPFSKPFSFDPSKGLLLLDFVASAPSGMPTGSLDAEQFPDTTTSTVYIVTGDPAQAVAKNALVGGLVLELDTAAAGPGPTVVGVTNAFSQGPELCPGVLANIYGMNFGSTAAAVTVTVGGKPAYVAAATPGQLTVQIPFEASVGSTTLTVTVSGTSSTPFNITLTTYAPAVNTIAGTGSGVGNVRTAKNVQVSSTAPASPGDTLIVYVTGLGASNPAIPTGVTPASPLHLAATMPTMTVGGVNATILAAALVPGSAGLWQINFTVPQGVQGSRVMAITIGGVSTTKPVTVPLFGITSIANNASQSSLSTAAAGSFVTIKANGLGSVDQITGFPATKFQGVQVTFNGIPAPMFHLIANPPAGATQAAQVLFQQQIDLLVPNELPTSGMVNVQLTTPAAFYPNFSLKMAPAVSGIYRINSAAPQPSTAIAQFNSTVWLVLPVSTTTAAGLPGNCSNSNISPLSLCGQPATLGDYLVLYATGLGITTPNGDPNGKPLATGVAPPIDGSVLYETPTSPTVTIGGVPVIVLFSGLAPGYPGLYQIVFQVPTGVASGDNVPVIVTMLGTSDTATLSIQPRP